MTDSRESLASDFESRGSEQRENVIRLALVATLVLIVAWVSGTLAVIAVVAALIVIVMLHELGHFVTAKLAGMKVTEYFFGFGPRLWSVRKGETEYGIKAVPLGGYVRILGMNNLDRVDPADEPRTYRQKPYWRQLSVAVAGSAMHFLIAFVLLFTLFVGVGMPDFSRPVVGEISQPGSGITPAQEAGLQLGDRLISIDGRPAANWLAVVDYIRSRPGATVQLEIERNGRRQLLVAKLATHNSQGEPVGFLGVRSAPSIVRTDPITAVSNSSRSLASLMWGSVRTLGNFFTPGSLRNYAANLSGERASSQGNQPGARSGSGGQENRFLSPVGFVRMASQAADRGLREVLQMLVLINVFVGVFNLAPMLPFDGGHVVLATYERIRSFRGRRYRADAAKLLPLTYAVVALLLFLAITSLWLDIARPIANPWR